MEVALPPFLRAPLRAGIHASSGIFLGTSQKRCGVKGQKSRALKERRKNVEGEGKRGMCSNRSKNVTLEGYALRTLVFVCSCSSSGGRQGDEGNQEYSITNK